MKNVITLVAALFLTTFAFANNNPTYETAMQTALNNPNRVNKLIVADIAPVQYPPHHQQILAGLQQIDLENIVNRKAADQQLAPFVETASIRQFLLRNLTTEQGKFRFKCNLNNISQAYSQIMQGQVSDNAFTNATLFIKGGDSDYITAEHKNIIAQLFPNSQAKIIANAGHWLHAEKPNLFNKIALNFLQQ